MRFSTTSYRITIHPKRFAKFCTSLGMPAADVPYVSAYALPSPLVLGHSIMAEYIPALNAIVFFTGEVEAVLAPVPAVDRQLAIMIALVHEVGHVLCLGAWRQTARGRLHNEAQASIEYIGRHANSPEYVPESLRDQSLRELWRLREWAADSFLDEILGSRKAEALKLVTFHET